MLCVARFLPPLAPVFIFKSEYTRAQIVYFIFFYFPESNFRDFVAYTRKTLCCPALPDDDYYVVVCVFFPAFIILCLRLLSLHKTSGPINLQHKLVGNYLLYTNHGQHDNSEQLALLLLLMIIMVMLKK